MEQFIFSVDAQTDQAVNKLQEINKLMNQIERIKGKGVDDYTTTSQKDMDKNMRSMSKLTSMYKQVDKELGEIQRKMRDLSDTAVIPEGATDSQIKQIERLREKTDEQSKAAVQQQKQLQSEYSKTLRSFRQLASFQQSYSKSFKHVFSSNDMNNLPQDPKRARSVVNANAEETDGVSSKLNGVMDKIKEVNKLDRRNESLSRRAEASKYMSNQQAASFSGDYATTRDSYRKEREQNLQKVTNMGMERDQLTHQIKDIETNPEASSEDIDRKIAMQQTIESMDKEIEARYRLSKSLDRTIDNMEDYSRKVEGVEVKPERGTFRGMVYERAPAIGLALGGAMGAAFGGLYMKGESVKGNMRDDVMSIGQRTNQEDWRTDVRDNAFDSGLQDELGFTGQEMLNFQNNYLSNRGFQDTDDLNTAMNSQAQFSRTTGVSADRTSSFFDNVFDSAKITGSQVGEIQNAFVGAIKQSGMEGREEQQLSALEGILGTVSEGRKLNEQDVMNVMGLQSLLGSSGTDELRGTTGGKFMADLNAGLRQGADNPMTRVMFGQGSEYQGLSGSWDLMKQMEKGISDVDNINTIGRIAEQSGGDEKSQNYAAYRFVRDDLGVDATTDQISGLMDLYREGALTQENILSVLESDLATGEQLSADKLGNYQNQKEATAEQSKAVTEKQSAQLNDFGDIVKDVNSSMGGIPAIAYGTIAALAALSMALLGTAGSFGMARGARKWAGGTYRSGGNWFSRRGTGGGPGGGTGGAGGGGGGMFYGGGGNDGKDRRPKTDTKTNTRTNTRTNRRSTTKFRGKGKFGWLANMVSMGANKAKGWFDPNVRKGGLPNTGGSVGSKGNMFSKGLGWLGKKGKDTMNILPGGGKGLGGGLGKIAGRALLPLAALTSIGSIMQAPKKERGRVVGESAGGILGGMGGGAAAGALVGSVVPGIGTAIGGLVGGIGGSIAGSKLGGWIGSKFGGDKNETTSSVREQVDRENTRNKEHVENKRGDNIASERTNLEKQEKVIEDYSRAISQQRFAMGVPTGSDPSNTSTLATSMAYNPSQTATGDSNLGKIRNFFSSNGFSPEATAGILGNLQQESSLNPSAENASSGAFGIGQWLGGRKTNLQNYAKENGMEANSLDAQLQFMLQEMNGGDSTTASILNKNGGLDSFKKMTDPVAAADLFEKAFERSGGSEMGKRRQYATGFYNQSDSAQWSTNNSSNSKNNNDMKVDSNITVYVTGDESVSDKVKNSQDLNKVAQNIQDKIYGSMSYHAQEMRRV
jgi:hypothetical protein